MPKPSASRPTHRSRHGIANTSALRVQRREASSSGTRPRNRTRGPSRRSSARAVEAPAVAAAARDRELHVGQPGDRVDEHVEALARHQPAHARARAGGRRRARTRVAYRDAFGGVDGPEAIDVDARRDDHSAERAPRRVHRLARRILARGDDARRAAQHARRRAARAGQPAGHRDLGAVHDDDVGRGAAGAARAGRAAATGRGRSPRAPTSRGERVDAAAPATASGRTATPCARTTRNGCTASHAVVAGVVRGEHRGLARRQAAATARTGTTGSPRSSAGSRW